MAKGSKKDLVIVESPAKARTVGRFLGDDYVVKASMGHVRDLPQRDMGVDVENGFQPTYVDVSGRDSVIRDIKKAARNAASVYLATDPDREGEAISWHLVEAADLSRNSELKRVVFHEITRPAIEEAFGHPRDIDMQLVHAQQARRILDRIVGYRLSPVLWSKVRRGLSAGRVQSVALRLIVDREREIEAFKPEEFWSIAVDLSKDHEGSTRQFKANLYAIDGEKGRLKVSNEKQATEIAGHLRAASYTVADVKQREVKQKPQPPFTTSTLQQEAARRHRYGAQRTMRLAQELYEGVQLGDGEAVGLITYMRTDSTTLSDSALAEANAFIKKTYGPEYADKPRTYKTKSRNAQEAHEAIRPTSVLNTPETVAPYLNPNQRRVYELIWKRMVASQMTDAVVDSTTADITAQAPSAPKYTVRATGSVMKFPGFRTLYIEGRDDESDEDDSRELPPLSEKDLLALVEVHSDQKFTQPPPRFTEAMLIRSLEEKGIGRPSTYASIVGTIEQRDYVAREKSRFKPTRLGIAVSDLLTANFPNVMDPGFTAEMESKLDAIAEGDIEWVPMLGEFYTPFDIQVEHAKKNAERVDRNQLVEETDEVCEKCERPMVIRSGRYGKFLSCSGFPECRNSRPIRITTGVHCPACEDGELLEKKNQKGRTFYGCSNYPKCDFLVGQRPLKEPCPECGELLISRGRNRAQCTKCEFKGAPPSAEESELAAAEA
ncbi:MAG: type I DNA topoisomerase [Dehalococcoidia bacterium]